jgi:hypothetical protein
MLADPAEVTSGDLPKMGRKVLCFQMVSDLTLMPGFVKNTIFNVF